MGKRFGHQPVQREVHARPAGVAILRPGSAPPAWKRQIAGGEV